MEGWKFTWGISVCFSGNGIMTDSPEEFGINFSPEDECGDHDDMAIPSKEQLLLAHVHLCTYQMLLSKTFICQQSVN